MIVRLSDRAYRDLTRLETWMADRSPATAERVGRLLSDALESLADFPGRGRSGPRPNLRELTVPFGSAAYLIQYRIDETAVLVARIVHSRERR